MTEEFVSNPFIEHLNRMIKADPVAMQKLLFTRTPCVEAIAIQRPDNPNGYETSMIEILDRYYGKTIDGVYRLVPEWTQEDESINMQLSGIALYSLYARKTNNND